MLRENQALAANEKFYQAFNKQSVERMLKVWHNDPESVCVHPGWEALNGFAAIMKSWQDIFENTDSMDIKLSDVAVSSSKDLAWVRCQENLFTISMSGVQTTRVYATNIFLFVDEEWKMVLHHASPVPGAASLDDEPGVD